MGVRLADLGGVRVLPARGRGVSGSGPVARPERSRGAPGIPGTPLECFGAGARNYIPPPPDFFSAAAFFAASSARAVHGGTTPFMRA